MHCGHVQACQGSGQYRFQIPGDLLAKTSKYLLRVVGCPRQGGVGDECADGTFPTHVYGSPFIFNVKAEMEVNNMEEGSSS